MSSKDKILQALRKQQAKFDNKPKIEEKRHVVTLDGLSQAELVARFIQEAEKLNCKIYHAETSDDAIQIILEILGEQTQVLTWADSALPFPIADTLAEQKISIAAHDDSAVEVGITGADAALAGTGSLILQSKQGQPRSVSLLPDKHIALIKREQVISDLETWVQIQQEQGFDAFKNSSNTVIISGPSKTADIAQELIEGAHGPRQVHIILLD